MREPIKPIVFATRPMSLEMADIIGQLFSEGKSLKEVSEITGYEYHVLLDIKRGEKFPEIKEKYNLKDVKEYSQSLSSIDIKEKVIPMLLSKQYSSDQEIADIFDCSAAQIRDIRLHRRRTHLTEGIDFTDCYIKPEVKQNLTPLEILQICHFIQDNPDMSYNDIINHLKKDIPNITRNLCIDIKLRRTHTDISKDFKW